MVRNIIALVLSSLLVWGGFVPRVSAAVIDTQQALAMQARASQIDKIQSLLAQADIRDAMVQLGVDPEQADLRVASLSDQELTQLQNRLDSLPAGGSTLALIGAVFVVLLILELTGLINIFHNA
ncbi:MAG: PA2779 family protein [Xanthomonadales bacterium]|nr:PA2779 family protein [Xanthomonadales bacterium]